MTDVLRQRALTLLRQSLADPKADFRAGQYEAIESLTQQRARLLVVQRTGWGKSSVYFLTTKLLRERGAGMALLISPLLALMRNQVIAAKRLGVRAATLNSSNKTEWPSVKSRLRADQIDILLVSPEMLAGDEFRQMVLAESRISFFIVDEAHCISDWGHDFRPEYLRITRVLQELPPNIPILATTATANQRVVVDVVSQLGPQLQVSHGPLVRESLQLQNIALSSKASRLAWLAEQVPQLPGSGIIYTLTVRDAESVARWLRSQSVDAYAYHADKALLAPEEREALEQRLLDNDVKALVATTALGMGFDKPDLSFVIHYQRPGSVVHYYQQVGRAGRALPQAYGVLLSGSEDRRIADYFLRTAFPPESHTEEVLGALRQAEDGLSVPMIEQRINIRKTQIEKALEGLEVHTPALIVKRDRRWYATAAPYIPDREKVERLIHIRRNEQERMQEYAQSRTCLMQFLANDLDDPLSAPCGRCSVCQGKLLLSETVTALLLEKADQFLRLSEQPILPKRQRPDRTRIPLALQAQEGRSLCLWGEDGWGELVRRGKQEHGHFDDALASAVVTMIRERWKPKPAPRAC